jgi:hydrophobic/amphiphilic exporter-1 (mainly G- bacteria), HAE1 family
MHALARLCVRRPVFASVLVLSLVVVGVFSYAQLGVDRFPKIDFPAVTIQTREVGAAPEEIETAITDKIEQAVNTISGIDTLVSTSSEGTSVVTVMFDLEKNIDVAAQEVRDRVSTVLGDLPRDIDPPVISKMDPDAAPVLSIAISGPASTRAITELADKTLGRQLESILGVGQVTIIGGRARQINVIVDPAKLASLGLTVAHVVQTLQTQNVQLPGGRVEQGVRDLTLRTYGRVETPEQFGEITIISKNGYPVRIRDVGRVEDGAADVLTSASVSGKPAVVLQVRKQSGTNTVEVIDRVKARLSTLGAQLPSGWRMDIVRDQSEYIDSAVHTVQEHLVLGSIFASGIVWLFLRKLRPTLISAIAIPSSLIATFAAMRYQGFTLNIITLLALTLAVGIVIDDAVVVLENIFRHLEEKDLSPMEAAVAGAKEVGLAVTATSLSLIAVFLPVAFMSGIVGRFMNSFGVSMAFAIAVSLLVSFTLTPMMASRWLRKDDVAAEETSRQTGFYAPIERTYLRLLDWSMAHRSVIVSLMVLVFLSTIPLAVVVNKNFLPVDDESQFLVAVRVPEGASVETTRTICESVATRIREFPEVTMTLLTIGDDPQRTANLGAIYVRMTPANTRKQSQQDVMDRVRKTVLPAYAQLGLRAQATAVPAFGSGNMAEIQFWVGGPDIRKLSEYSAALLGHIQAQPGVVDADTNLIVGRPELGVRVDRSKAADLGVRVQDIASTLSVLVGGQKVSDYYEDGEQYEVHVRAQERYRRDAQGIAQAQVPASRVAGAALRDLVRLDEGTGPSLINRIARRRQVLVYANMLPGHSSQAVMDSLVRTADGLKMPTQYSYGFTGRSREQTKAMRNFMMAFLLSILFMYMILAAQFESWIHPVTILLALPMTLPFALLSIVVLNQSINIFSMLGILVLFGIVKKNGILQVDHTNGLRALGLPRAQAIRDANRDRLRPILMTTLAFVAGMIPLVVSSGTGSGTNRAIGSVILGGQTLSLLLTLVGTPVLYSIFDDWAESRLWARTSQLLTGRRPAVSPAEALERPRTEAVAE